MPVPPVPALIKMPLVGEQPRPSAFELFLASRSEANAQIDNLNGEERDQFMKDLKEEWELMEESKKRREAESRDAHNAEMLERQKRTALEEAKRAAWRLGLVGNSNNIDAVPNDDKQESKYASLLMRLLEGGSGAWARRGQLR